MLSKDQIAADHSAVTVRDDWTVMPADVAPVGQISGGMVVAFETCTAPFLTWRVLS